jgi:uncharacterized protein YyaL (SSP411 family)
MNNELHLSNSLYLKQHENNPVHWKMWSERVWEDAARSNKLVIVSIGYSSCHWCHVMEREVFEHEDAADVMNAHFVSIKVDREERPDIDQIYMTAVQMMAGQGGWPLNVVCLPDKRPIWGATYAPKDQWMRILLQLQKVYNQEPEKVREYAEQMESGLKDAELLSKSFSKESIDDQWLQERLERIERSRDFTWGGYQRAPKFPMPHEQRFLLQAAEKYERDDLHKQVLLTLKRMAWGGMYDYVGGGFCRYSVDGIWKVPHFEKMLYDNAQLLSAYAIAHRMEKNPLFEATILQTFAFLQREMRTPQGLYASAIDADSEGVEGKFYTFSEEELRNILAEDYPIWEAIFDFKEAWEERFIIFRLRSNQEASETLGIGVDQIEQALERGRAALFAAREKRIRPVTDFKAVVAWNGLLLTGLCDAYLALGKEDLLEAAIALAENLHKHVWVDGQLYRIYAQEKAYIQGMLEDYASLSRGLLHLFSVSGDEKWYHWAEELLQSMEEHFSDDQAVFFYLTGNWEKEVITRSRDLEDNVIPSPNAIAADAMRLANTITYREQRKQRWEAMVRNAAAYSAEVKTGFYLWGELYLRLLHGANKEWIVSGPQAKEQRNSITQDYFDFYTDFFLLNGESELEIFKLRYGQQTRHFICTGMQCERPMEIEEIRERVLRP